MNSPDTPVERSLPGEHSRSRLSHWLILLMLFSSMAVMTSRLIDAEPLGSANDRSRWCTVWSLVYRGTFQIDEIRRRAGWDTIDLVRHEEHFYSSKPPLLPVIAAALCYLIYPVTGWDLETDLHYTSRTVLFFMNIVPMSAALYVLTQLFARYCRSKFGEALLMITACWGVLWLPFLTVFNNHTPAVTAVIFALWAGIGITIENRNQWWRYLWAGLCAGAAASQELPATSFLAALGLILYGKSRRSTLTWFLPAAVLPWLAFFVTNLIATGGVIPFYNAFGTEKYEFIYEGVPSYWMDPKGVDRSQDLPLTYLFHCVVGHHGLLSLSPILLLTVIGWVTRAGWIDTRFRDWNRMSAALTLIVLGFYISRTDSYNYGGVSVALRWMLWLIPLWLFSMIGVLNLWGNESWMRLLCVPLLAVSIFSAWYPRGGPWTQPWLFQLLSDWKWIDYSDPRPELAANPHTWLRRLPGGDLDTSYWVEFQAYDTDGLPQSIRIADAGPVLADGKEYRSLVLSMDEPLLGRAPWRGVIKIDVSQHAANRPPEEFLVQELDGRSHSRLCQFLSGVPGPARYQPSRVRYVKARVRTDALECVVASTAVSRRLAEDNRSLLVIREAWFSNEVPFGLVQWDDRVLDAARRIEQSRSSWSLHACGRMFARSPRPGGQTE